MANTRTMLMVNQEEDAMKSEPLINISSRVDDGDSLMEETGLIHCQLENEIMVAGKLQEQRLDTYVFFHPNDVLYLCLSLLVGVGGGTLQNQESCISFYYYLLQSVQVVWQCSSNIDKTIITQLWSQVKVEYLLYNFKKVYK